MKDLLQRIVADLNRLDANTATVLKFIHSKGCAYLLQNGSSILRSKAIYVLSHNEEDKVMYLSPSDLVQLRNLLIFALNHLDRCSVTPVPYGFDIYCLNKLSDSGTSIRESLDLHSRGRFYTFKSAIRIMMINLQYPDIKSMCKTLEASS